ncbi:hypothetical protein AMTR_s00093p00075800 [Amborella trichopoda]|uniref:Uncharacterized protein n=1 Tax=Amborella trichopoda TaxID=13333 RepID=W1NU61_AMBTC|nr:hypothetical protein AMTR_s00093p00075800 [Amborella trichopoda]
MAEVEAAGVATTTPRTSSSVLTSIGIDTLGGRVETSQASNFTHLAKGAVNSPRPRTHRGPLATLGPSVQALDRSSFAARARISLGTPRNEAEVIKK